MINNHEAIIIVPGHASEVVGKAITDYFGAQVMVVDAHPNEASSQAIGIINSTRKALEGRKVVVVFETERTKTDPSLESQLTTAHHLRNLGIIVIVWSTMFPQDIYTASSQLSEPIDIRGLHFSVKRPTQMPLINLIREVLGSDQGNQQ